MARNILLQGGQAYAVPVSKNNPWVWLGASSGKKREKIKSKIRLPNPYLGTNNKGYGFSEVPIP